MQSPWSWHDRFFNAVIDRFDVAADLIRLYLPVELVARLDLDSLTRQPDSFLDGLLQGHLTDALFKVNQPGGGSAYIVFDYRRNNPDDATVRQHFEAVDEALLEFLHPTIGGGVRILRPFMHYLHPQADDFVTNVLERLDHGTTVILDLGNTADEVRQYFSDRSR